MKKRAGNIFWGVLFIAAAALLLISELGLLSGIGFRHIVFSVLWGAWIIKGLFSRESFSVFMGLAFLAILWNKELGIEAITPWPVIGAALLLTIGWSLIFRGIGRRKWEKSYSCKYNINNESGENNMEFQEEYSKNKSWEGNANYGTDCPHQSHVEGEHVYHMNRFSGAQKYIDSQNLKSVEIINKAGGMEVYLDNARAAGDKVYMRIECYAGGLEIYIPRNWKLENKVDCFMGTIDGPEMRKEDEAVNDVTLILSGTVKAGGVEIIRV
ncbi:MAG: hypothetical protein HFG29_08980 [Eubacterium sp.]|nr:hypothetical protein [Eubacterium sp.]